MDIWRYSSISIPFLSILDLFLHFVTLISTEFPTSRVEMEAVANIFDRDNDGYIDYKEFVSALRPPERRPLEPTSVASRKTDSEKIQDEVQRAVSACTCHRQFLIEKVGEGKYRVSVENHDSSNVPCKVFCSNISSNVVKKI